MALLELSELSDLSEEDCDWESHEIHGTMVFMAHGGSWDSAASGASGQGFLTGGTQAAITYPTEYVKTQLQLQSNFGCNKHGFGT